MNENHTASTPLGLAAFSVLMLQDLAVVPLLILIGAMSQSTGGNPAWLVSVAMLKAAAAIAVIYLVGGRLLHPLFRTFARQRQPDVFMALILLATLGIAALSAMAGLSMALGALIAGLLLAETEFKHEIELMIEPFKGLLMGLFFMTVGMGMDVRQIAANPLWLAGALAGLVLVKGVVVAVLLRFGGMNRGRAIEGGLMLAQGGEFAFIVIGYAVAGKLVDARLGQMVMLTVGLSLFITPLLTRLGRTIGDNWEQRADTQAAGLDNAALDKVRGHVIIAGFGRVGQQLAKLLSAQKIPYVAFENNAKLVARMRKLNLPVFFGDASRTELLRRVDARVAPAIVLTMDHPAAALQAVRDIRRDFPNVALLARSRDEKHALALKQAGATIVVPETLEASLQLSASVLETMGLDENDIDRIVDDERDLFRDALAAAARVRP
jgi:CPA2 family monovalent cation:H+ antiporter-2